MTSHKIYSLKNKKILTVSILKSDTFFQKQQNMTNSISLHATWEFYRIIFQLKVKEAY